MRRKVLHRVVVYGLVGLVANVLVAWSFAAWGSTTWWHVTRTFRVDANSPVGPAPDVVQYQPLLGWSMASELLPGSPSSRSVRFGSGVWVIQEAALMPFHAEIANGKLITEDPVVRDLTLARFGWPLAALRWHSVEERTGQLMTVVARSPWVKLPSGLASRPGLPAPRRLPLEPVWLGFAINTVGYGALAAVGVALVTGGRRVARRRRGRCPLCAYDLQGALKDGCPECGWAKVQVGSVEKA